VNPVLEETLTRLIGYATDIYVACRGIGQELEAWSRLPSYGQITVGSERYMAVEQPTPIPSDDIPAVVEWQDKLGTGIEHAKTDTSWSAEDEAGTASTVVTVTPDADSDGDDETALVTFSASAGQFRVVATTAGASGQVRAQSVLYDIQPGAPAVGTITLG
jgi:hypothetical protein